MQSISFFLFTIICGYSLVISAPVNPSVPNSQETKQQKATAIAGRLLKELAGEQIASNHQEQSSNKDESKDTIVPVNQHAVEKTETHVEKQNNDIVNDKDDDDTEFLPTLDELYEIYSDKYAQLADDEESSSEIDDDEIIIPVSREQLIRYLAEQEESDEQLTPVIHTPVMDDSIMTAEEHQRRRRRSIY